MARFSIPDDFPLHELVTQELINLSIGRHSLAMAFTRVSAVVAGVPKYEDGASIWIEAGFTLETPSGEVITADNADLSLKGAHLLPLLEQQITSVDRQPNNQLSLKFSGGSELLLIVDEQGYESYHLQIAGESIDVTKEW
jgi:hypothetical protein